MGKETLKIVLLKGIHDESLEILNLMGTSDVFRLPYDDICELCRRYSRGNFKIGKNSSEPSSQYFKSAAKTRVIGAEIINSIENFKVDIISSLNSQLDILKDKKKWGEPKETVCPRCQKKHLAMDCPLDSLIISGICDLSHSTDRCPSLPKIKAIYQRDRGVVAISPQQPWPTCMIQNSIPPFPYSHKQSLNTRTLWKLLQPQSQSYLPFPQGWHGPSYDPMTTFPHVSANTNPPYFPQALQQHPIFPLRSSTQTNQLYFPYLTFYQALPCPTKLPVQPTSHPNHNKVVQYTYSADLHNFPTFTTYPTSPTPLQQIHMRSGQVVSPRIENEVSYHHQQTDKINKSDENQTLEPKSEASSTSWSLDMNLFCIQEDQFSKEIHGVTSIGNQGNKDSIESWFQSITNPQLHVILKQFLAQSFQGKLVFHIVGMSIFETLLRKWLHWKYSYT